MTTVTTPAKPVTSTAGSPATTTIGVITIPTVPAPTTKSDRDGGASGVFSLLACALVAFYAAL